MILILSSKEDGHVPLVTRELDKREASYLCFDPGDFPEHATVSFRLTTNGAARWILKLCEQEYQLDPNNSCLGPAAERAHSPCGSSRANYSRLGRSLKQAFP